MGGGKGMKVADPGCHSKMVDQPETGNCKVYRHNHIGESIDWERVMVIADIPRYSDTPVQALTKRGVLNSGGRRSQMLKKA